LSLHWKYIFVINIPIAVLIIIWASRVLPSERIAEKISIDWPGILALVSALTLYALSVNQVDSRHILQSIGDPWILIPYLVSVVLMVFFYFRELRVESPVINPHLLRSKQLMIVYLLAFGAGLAQLAGLYLPSIASLFFGVSNSEASFMLLPLVIALFISAPIAGKLVDTIGSKNVLIIGQVVMVIGLAVFGFYFKERTGFYAAEALTGAGIAFVVGSPLRYIMNQETETSDRASGQAVLTLFTSTGQLSSAAMVGAIIASMGGGMRGYRTAFQVLMYISIVLLFVSFGLRNSSDEEES
ncbi:MAG TPA: MFS transporter, partial [Bacteroidales bacterium]|nr:MFS transporter [Bacteroidales bacterium]